MGQGQGPGSAHFPRPYREAEVHTKKHQTPGTSAQAQDPFQSENMSQGYQHFVPSEHL